MEEKHDDGGDNVQTLIKEVTRINISQLIESDIGGLLLGAPKVKTRCG